MSCYRAIKEEYKGYLIEDLEQIKRKNADMDGKLCIIGKDEIKEKLGRSPDFSDAMMMRMYFELQKARPIAFAGWEDTRRAPMNAHDTEFQNFLYG